ncbi:unnamed protein product, partial [Polarella glacialis]
AFSDCQRDAGAKVRDRLQELRGRLFHFTEIIGRRAQIEREFEELTKQVAEERRGARERERSLALELAEVDAELADLKGRLARSRAKKNSAADMALKKASKPLALEACWAADAADCPGQYVVTSTAIMSPHMDLLNPTDPVALEVGMRIRVIEVVRCKPLKRIRARVERPSGWISLLNMEAGTRWARKEASQMTELEGQPAAEIVEESAGSRSAALRGWSARVDMQAQAFQEVLQNALGSTGGSASDRADRGGQAAGSSSLAPMARQLANGVLSRCASTMVAEVRTGQMYTEREGAAMALADEESAAAALSLKVRERIVLNGQLTSANLELQKQLEEVKYKWKPKRSASGTLREEGQDASWGDGYDLDVPTLVKRTETDGHHDGEPQRDPSTASSKSGLSQQAPKVSPSHESLGTKSGTARDADALMSSDEEATLKSFSYSQSKAAHEGQVIFEAAVTAEQVSLRAKEAIDSQLRKAASLHRQRAERMQ